jgi:hypothetical protein
VEVPLRSIRHPLSGAVYDLRDGRIHVTSRDGREGMFDHHGRWLSGELKHADPHLCLWIGGAELPTRIPQRPPATSSAASSARDATTSEETPR